MKFATFIPSQADLLQRSLSNRRGFSPAGNTRRSQAVKPGSRIFYDPDTGRPSFIVEAKKSGSYGGRLGAFVSMIVYYQVGVRYFTRFFDRAGNNLGGLVSTAGTSAGATTSEGICEKLNGSVYSTDFNFRLIENFTGKDYGDTATTFGASTFLVGGKN